MSHPPAFPEAEFAERPSVVGSHLAALDLHDLSVSGIEDRTMT
jgi:hypothetical protein